MGCVLVKPIVDRIESEFKGKLRIIRLDIQSPAGHVLADRYRFQYTPTFIFFDAQGKEQWRSVGRLDPDQVRQSLAP
jgi:thioredoxin-related protein